MKTAKQIQHYLHTETNGLINITQAQAQHIAGIVLNSTVVANAAIAKLYRYDAVINNYIFIRTVQTTDEAIKQEIINALNTTPAKNFYKYECYNSQMQFEGNIQTVNPCLF
jgi:hypothetical protein